MKSDNFAGIADYISQRRAQAQLSQEALASALISNNDLFADVDSLAISRWERGKVSPNLRRQVALMEYFGDKPHTLLCDPSFELKQLPSLDAFNKMMEQQLNYNHVMGAHPYISADNVSFDKLCKQADEAPQMYSWIANYHTNLSRGREKWSQSFIKSLAAVDSTEVSFYQVNGLLAGHIFMVKVTEETFEQLLHGKLNDNELTPAHLIAAEQPGCLYMLSTYLGGAHVSEDFVAQLLFTLVENPVNTSFGYKARSDIGIKLMDFLGGVVVNTGEILSERLQGAKYQGKRRSYVSFELQRQVLIASPLFINLIRNSK
ncbi:hypothetical protein CXF83_20350 [Shewanella sp. Choline-02u-19]|uniref:helix-turn-helix domain-containing protein n=1 Tax=unclassified Shewanella TaxID=196818 RepID=UPI000C31BD58|nr:MULTISPECIES: helix-turn-helix transcriptional regulator [unclassified Shewanella]PKG56312.1 hypothetical protein CXF82_15565 [Shewanella sp. GutDb-MelDb]PKH53862.1 hypothetical protein CXF84_21570 [Shewanella sp. Bg11-22]PKI28886.1 hypothetical protein CXF83_20350 [Shewanella sp. Choline-02u-19]